MIITITKRTQTAQYKALIWVARLPLVQVRHNWVQRINDPKSHERHQLQPSQFNSGRERTTNQSSKKTKVTTTCTTTASMMASMMATIVTESADDDDSL